MADGYDRFENEGGGGGSFVMACSRAQCSARARMLFAPKSGSELRNQLSEQAGNLANTASEGYRKGRRHRRPVGANRQGDGERVGRPRQGRLR